MKNLVDLAGRVDWEFHGYPCERTVRENGYTLVFKSSTLRDLQGMDFTQKRLVINQTSNHETGYIVKYEGPKSICLASYYKDYRCFDKRIFAKREWTSVVRFDGRKVIVRKGGIHSGEFLDFFLAYFGVECLSQQLPDRVLERILYSKTVLKAIFTQKITNPRDAVRLYMNTSWKLKDISYDLVLRGFSACIDWDVAKNFVTSIEDYVDFVQSKSYISPEARIFHDLIRDAQCLDFRVNPKWSKKRMEQEHNRCHEKLMLLMDSALSDKPVREGIDTVIDGPVRGIILNSERETYREGSQMHHCIYTHYFEYMLSRNYIGLSFQYPERCTVGLVYKESEKKFVLDQIHTIRNGSVQGDTREIILKYIREHQAFFDSLGPAKSSRHTGPDIPGEPYPRNAFVGLIQVVDDDLPY